MNTEAKLADAEQTLTDAEAKGRQLRLRVSGTFVQLAWMLFVLAVGPSGGQFLGVDLTLIAGAPGFYNAALPWAVALLFLSLRPTNTRAITFTCIIIFAFLLIATGVFFILAAGGLDLILPFICASCAALVWPTLNVRLTCRSKGLEIGTVVKIKNLKSRPELNGCEATVIDFRITNKRYDIQLSGGKGEKIAVKPENIQEVGGKDAAAVVMAKCPLCRSPFTPGSQALGAVSPQRQKVSCAGRVGRGLEARLAKLTELARAEAEAKAKAKAEKVAAEVMAARENAAAEKAKKEVAEYAKGAEEQNTEARKLTEAERVEMGILREMGLWVEMGLAPMPPRRKLKRLWRAFRLVSVGFATLFLAFCINETLDDPFDDPMAPQGTESNICISASWLIASLVLTPANRGRVVAWLGSLGKSNSKENEAAALAALVNNLSAAEAFKRGKELFRKLPFSRLTPEDLPGTSKVLGGSSNGMSAAAQPTKELSEKTEKAILHEVDAFISHSWSDDGDAKYARMKEWAAGRDVSIWLDKACLDQQDITKSLAGLPVFLSGCKQLLVLAGPTYASRLWCVMEIFVFVRMGSKHLKHEDMDVRLLSGTDEGWLQQKLLKFDAGQALCFDPNDRERLWAVIEAAFGTFDPFNKIVRDMLTKKLLMRDASRGTQHRHSRRG